MTTTIYPTDQSNPAGATPVQIATNGLFLNNSNPLPVTVISGGGASNIQIQNNYIVTTQFVDANGTCHIGDILQNIITLTPIGVVVTSIWFNLTCFFPLAAVPPSADIQLSTSNAPIARTASNMSVTVAGTISDGANNISFLNISPTVTATVAGGYLPPGVSLSFQATGHDTINAISYDPGMGGQLLIGVLR